jgi:hypothetical protein
MLSMSSSAKLRDFPSLLQVDLEVVATLWRQSMNEIHQLSNQIILKLPSNYRTSIEESSTVSGSGSFGTRNDMRGKMIGGPVPSAQNSGLRRL